MPDYLKLNDFLKREVATLPSPLPSLSPLVVKVEFFEFSLDYYKQLEKDEDKRIKLFTLIRSLKNSSVTHLRIPYHSDQLKLLLIKMLCEIIPTLPRLIDLDLSQFGDIPLRLKIHQEELFNAISNCISLQQLNIRGISVSFIDNDNLFESFKNMIKQCKSLRTIFWESNTPTRYLDDIAFKKQEDLEFAQFKRMHDETSLSQFTPPSVRFTKSQEKLLLNIFYKPIYFPRKVAPTTLLCFKYRNEQSYKKSNIKIPSEIQHLILSWLGLPPVINRYKLSCG